DCKSGETCVVEVNDFYFSETFDAHASEGWIFVGWKLGSRYFCQNSESVCHLSNKGLGQYEAIKTIVESDETFYLEPEFVKRTPLDEALSNVQDETLRACLQKVSAPRRYAEQIRTVNCYADSSDFSTVASLQGIEAFVRIEHLVLGGAASLEDLTPLSGLSRLQGLVLRLKSNSFNAAALSELRLLTELDLYFGGAFSIQYSSAPDLSEIGSLKSLRFLTLSTALGRGKIDASSLNGLNNLEYLDLRKIKDNDISPLAGLRNLKILHLDGNEISDIRALAGLDNLEHLDLHSNKIDDIGPLAGLNNLESLDLHNNEIDDIGPLAEIDSIPRLYLQNNLIQDASPLRQHYPLSLDTSFGLGIDVSYYGAAFGLPDAPFGVSLDISNNPIINIGDALDGIRAGAIFLIDVPLMCQEYSRLVEKYDSRAIITKRETDGYASYYIYKIPLRCI
ncbi:leucine-rich repeat domain-containing protein, partial [Pseudomonadota bacterium]